LSLILHKPIYIDRITQRKIIPLQLPQIEIPRKCIPIAGYGTLTDVTAGYGRYCTLTDVTACYGRYGTLMDVTDGRVRLRHSYGRYSALLKL
ncbi:hypothetical protein V1477_014467, partial [Vespula maculifrons]